MNIEEYINLKKKLYDIIHQFIENESEIEYSQIISIIRNQKILENREELKTLLLLLIKISNNHHRYPEFFSKIQKIIIDIRPSIEEHFNNYEIFDLFKNNKFLLLFLIEIKLLTVDETIFNLIYEIGDTTFTKYRHFFYPEIKKFINENEQKEIETELMELDTEIFVDFNEKRKIGQNSSYLAHLIRNDMVEDFITHISKQQFSPSSIMEQSIFETNPFLIKHQATLIEYAAFFGSIQIFQYLKLNNANLPSLLWHFVIHSQNAELIHILEENDVEPEDKSFLKCLKEAIKCHHNEIANYIVESYLDENKLTDKFIDFGLHYYNYSYLENNFCYSKSFLYYSYFHDQFEIVNLLLKTKKIELNEKSISLKKILIMKFFSFYV